MKLLIMEFMLFLKEYKVVALAVAFVIATASTSLIKSLVDNIIMPIVTPFLLSGAWRTATFSIGPVVIGWGAFLAELINFVILATVVFMIAKYLIKEDKEEKAEKAKKVSKK